MYSKFLFPNRAVTWFPSPAWKDAQAEGHLFPLCVRICSIVSLSPVRLPGMFSPAALLYPTCGWLVGLCYDLLGSCVRCALVRGAFLYLVSEFLFSCSLSSLKHSPSKWTTGGKEPQCTPEAGLGSPRPGVTRQPRPKLAQSGEPAVCTLAALWPSSPRGGCEVAQRKAGPLGGGFGRELELGFH